MKMSQGLFVIVLMITSLSATRVTAADDSKLPPLIPREVLFGNPVKASPKISPDGTRLAYLAPSDKNVLNVWVRTLGQTNDTMVTQDTHRGIRNYSWAENNRQILYVQDLGGDENWHLYAADLESKIVRDLTPFQGVRAQNLLDDKHFPNEILIGLNMRDRRVFDMYRIDLQTGAVVLDTRNPGDVVGWITDDQFQIRGAMAANPKDGSKIFRVRESKEAPWRELVTWPFGENGGPWGFTQDGKAVYLETSLGSDTTRLVKMEVATGKEIEELAQHPKVDVGGGIMHPDTRRVQAVSFNFLKKEWQVLDPAVKKDVEILQATVKDGEFSLLNRDHADQTWVVSYNVDNGPVPYYIYHRDSQKAEFLFFNQPALSEFVLARQQPVVIKARDGFELVSYLTMPPGVPAKNLPMVLLVHGGPWARDAWGFNPTAQWLANRGYACLQVNFRGSAGFGKAFLNAGNLEWGVGKMQHDLTDAVRWAVAKGVADPERVCIFGGSYGGYAALAGLAFTPELYACGVDIVGPSHIKTLFEAIPPYWAPIKKELVLRVGDVEADDELNRRISPFYHADKIKDPLIIAQGANDPRVNIRESDQIVEAMRDKGLPVTYIVYTDEGHGFARPENRLDFYGRVDEFLAKHLGGRAEPWKELKGSSASAR